MLQVVVGHRLQKTDSIGAPYIAVTLSPTNNVILHFEPLFDLASQKIHYVAPLKITTHPSKITMH